MKNKKKQCSKSEMGKCNTGKIQESFFFFFFGFIGKTAGTTASFLNKSWWFYYSQRKPLEELAVLLNQSRQYLLKAVLKP